MTHIKCSLMKMKAELKVLAIEIRTFKSKRKELKGYVPGLGSAQWKFRTNHIAYCMIRGKTIEQIEPKVRNPGSYEHKALMKEVAAIVASVVNPQPPQPAVVQKPVAIPTQPTVEVKKETLWNKVTSFLS